MEEWILDSYLLCDEENKINNEQIGEGDSPKKQ